MTFICHGFISRPAGAALSWVWMQVLELKLKPTEKIAMEKAH